MPWKNDIFNDSPEGCSILVVEDDLMQRMLLTNVLEAKGYGIIQAEDGEDALKQLEGASPDLIISDIVMPNMDGFEFCRRVKNSPDTQMIPVILVTSLDTKEDVLKGIDAGANEFLTKPIEPRELSLRVRNAIRTRKLFQKLEQNLIELKELEALRDSLVHMVVHDMRSVLTGILTTADFLYSKLEGRLDEMENNLYGNIMSSSTTLLEMVSTVLDVNRMDDGKMPLDKSVADMRDILKNAFDLLGVDGMRDRVRYSLPETPVRVECDAGMICRVVTNLISNGIKYTRNLDDGWVEISLDVEGDRAVVRVSDNGQGIPESDREIIFEKYSQSSLRHQKKRYSSGLGLYFCKKAIEAHDGKIGVDAGRSEGASFFFELEICRE